MANGNNDGNDEDSRHDLTRIEDLSEFLHEEDPDVEDRFDEFSPPVPNEKTAIDDTIGLSLDELDDSNEAPPEVPEAPMDFGSDPADTTVSEMNFGDDELDSSNNFDFDAQAAEPTDQIDQLDDAPFELSDNFSDDNDNDIFAMPEAEAVETVQESNDDANDDDDDNSFTMPHIAQEKFEEVKNFAQNFSYGQVQGGGNPPFSLILRNLKYENDAEDIITLLREFGVVTDANEAETKKALSIGSLLVPQIGEYCAIVLAHKLRRYDCDLEVGLSDEVHPSKSGDANPRGLIRKDSLRQNISESFKKGDNDIQIKEIIVSTTATLSGHIIQKYIGVQTSFAIVDEEELERLKYVQKAARDQSELHQYETDDSVTTERAFRDYQNSFDLLFTDLCDQLKVKALKEKANALIGLNYQLTSMPFEKSSNGGHCYQLTCSATLAVVTAE